MEKKRRRVVYLDEEYIPEEKAKISIFDSSVHVGDAVFEASRTFNKKPFKLREHIARLLRSIRSTKMEVEQSPEEIERISVEVLKRNIPLLRPNEEYWIYHVVSLGIYPPFRQEGVTYKDHLLLIYCWPIGFRDFAKYYKIGAHAVVPLARRIPPECIDPKAKSISRMELNIGGREVKLIDSAAYPLYLDIYGNIAEGKGYNFFMVRDGTLITPGPRNVLRGISRQTVIELAHEMRIPVKETDIQMYDVYNADEACFTTTSFCILPVTRLNNQPIGSGKPGEITKSLLNAWSEKVGIDIVEQALSHLSEEERGQLDER